MLVFLSMTAQLLWLSLVALAFQSPRRTLAATPKFDPRGFAANWACPQSGSFLGNFPENYHYDDDNHGYMLSAAGDFWTTFPMKDAKYHLDDHFKPLAKPWLNSSLPFGFLIKPAAYGPENRVLIQMALDDKSPTRPPYPNATEIIRYNHTFLGIDIFRFEKKGFENMAYLMKKGIFNCHINRYLSVWDMVVKNKAEENETIREQFIAKRNSGRKMDHLLADGHCKEGGNDSRHIRHECEEARGGMDKHMDYRGLYPKQLTCGVQAAHPICCYTSWKDIDKISQHMGKEYTFGEPDGYCKTRQTPEKEDFFLPPRMRSLGRIAECRSIVKGRGKAQKALFTKKLECNPLFMATAKTCGFVGSKGENLHFPCLASCYDSMVLQLEITPLKKQPAEFHLTAAVRRHHRLSQPPYNVGIKDKKGEHRLFGYKASLTDHRTDYLGAKIENKFSAKNRTFSTDRYVGVWLSWENRTQGRNPVGPLLKVGGKILILFCSKNNAFFLLFRLVRKAMQSPKWS